MLPTGILIVAPLPSEAVPFVYLASVCRSLQCLISALTQAAEVVSCSGSLVQSCCREGGALQTNVTGLCGEHWQCSGHTGFAPVHGMCFPRLHCSGSWLLYMERALLCVRLQFSGPPQKHSLVWACVCAFPARAPPAARSLMGALSPVQCALSPPWAQPQFPHAPVVCALCLFSGAGL